MGGFVRPPIFDVPRGPSFGGVLDRISQSLNQYMETRNAEEERRRRRKAEDIAAEMEGENRLLDLAPVLSEFEEGAPTPMPDDPGSPELGLAPKPSEAVPLGGKRLAKPLLEEITLPDGRKIPIPPVRGMREQLQAEAEAKRLKDTEVITQETWDALPEFYKSRWKPGQRVSADDVGAVGMKILETAKSRSSMTTKSVFDRIAKRDVLKTEEDIAKEPDRYGPAQEARLTAAADRADREAQRRADREAAAADKAEAAAEKKRDRQTQIDDWVQSLADGQPIELVPASMKNEVNSAYRKTYGKDPLNRWQTQQESVISSIEGMIDRLEQAAAPVLDITDDPATSLVPGGVRAAGYLAGLKAKLGKAPEVKNLQNIEAELTRVSRGLADERGNISDKDVVRITKAIPQVGDTREEVANKIKQLRAIASERRAGAKLDPRGPSGAAAPSPVSSSLESLMKEYGY